MSRDLDKTTLYIVGVSNEVEEDKVREAFGIFGPIEKLTLLKVRPPFKTRTLFIKYVNSEDATRAKSVLNETDPFGKNSVLSIKFSEKNHVKKEEPQSPPPVEYKPPVYTVVPPQYMFQVPQYNPIIPRYEQYVLPPNPPPQQFIPPQQMQRNPYQSQPAYPPAYH